MNIPVNTRLDTRVSPQKSRPVSRKVCELLHAIEYAIYIVTSFDDVIQLPEYLSQTIFLCYKKRESHEYFLTKDTTLTLPAWMDGWTDGWQLFHHLHTACFVPYPFLGVWLMALTQTLISHHVCLSDSVYKTQLTLKGYVKRL